MSFFKPLLVAGLTCVLSVLAAAPVVAQDIDFDGILDFDELAFGTGFFKEFAVRTTKDVNAVLEHCRVQNILAGVPLAPWYPELADCFLVAVTEKRSRQQIDALVDALDDAPVVAE